MITIVARTHPGNVRRLNEDCALTRPDIGLIALADGMGGHMAGEVASQRALESLQDFVDKSAAGPESTWPFAIDPNSTPAANRLLTALKVANQSVLEAAGMRLDRTGMGTTLVAGIIESDRFTYTSVGDSRVYLLTEGRLRQLSRDDSLIAMLQEQTGGDPAAIRDHPMRNVLTRVVGVRPELTVTADEQVLHPGDVIMLTSDGLHGAIPHDQLAAIVTDHQSLDATADRLIATALQADGSDNITVVLAAYTG